MFRVEKFLGTMRVSGKLTAAFALVIGLMAAASVLSFCGVAVPWALM